MALWTIGTPTKVRPPEVEPKKPKRTRGVLKRIAWVMWITAALVSVAAITILVWNIATQGLFTGDAIPRTVQPTVTVTTTPSTIPPTTEPVVVPPVVTMTTVKSSTTTTTLPGFYWGTEPAPLGLLIEEPLSDGIHRVMLSGDFIGVTEKLVLVPFVEGSRNRLIARFNFGEHPQTGELIVGKFLLGQGSDSQKVGVCQMLGRWLGIDPTPSPPAISGRDCNITDADDVVVILQVGRRYPITIDFFTDCNALPAEHHEKCRQYLESGGDVMVSYNQNLVNALRDGGEIPIGFGVIVGLDIPLSGQVSIR